MINLPLMNPTQAKVNRNLAGLQYLLNRPDTADMPPQTATLTNVFEKTPAFYICRHIMHDGLTIIGISLRVYMKMFTKEDEQYQQRDIIGRGTTFEMALFDLSAKLIKCIDENDYVLTDHIPIITTEGENHGSKNSDTGIRANEPAAVEHDINTSEQDVAEGMAARSDDTGGRGPDARGDREPRRKAAGRGRGRGHIKRSGR